MPGSKTTGLLDKAVAKIAPKAGAKAAWPIAVSALQKSGSLAKGSLKPTAKGVARNKMSAAKRAATRS